MKGRDSALYDPGWAGFSHSKGCRSAKERCPYGSDSSQATIDSISNSKCVLVGLTSRGNFVRDVNECGAKDEGPVGFLLTVDEILLVDCGGSVYGYKWYRLEVLSSWLWEMFGGNRRRLIATQSANHVLENGNRGWADELRAAKFAP
jgi:hypothetical protein